MENELQLVFSQAREEQLEAHGEIILVWRQNGLFHFLEAILEALLNWLH